MGRIEQSFLKDRTFLECLAGPRRSGLTSSPRQILDAKEHDRGPRVMADEPAKPNPEQGGDAGEDDLGPPPERKAKTAAAAKKAPCDCTSRRGLLHELLNAGTP